MPQAFPAGEFYSPIVDARALLGGPDRERVWPDDVPDPPGVDLRAPAQLALLRDLTLHPMPPDVPGYDPANDQFPPHDAAVLYAMVHHLRPRRFVEIGSGWSTTVTAAAIADSGSGTALTCIEPYPRDFLRTMEDRLTLRVEQVEHSPLSLFDDLEAGDVCFIDSSHVAKTGSDVIHELLVVVPRLAPGVIVHVHDIFLPEDYPQGWVRNGFNWNEQYVLQAYLVGNRDAHVLLANHWLALRHPEAVQDAFALPALHGSSFWFSTGPAPDGVG